MTPLTPPAAASPSLPLAPVFVDMDLTPDEQLVAPSPDSSIKRPPGRPAGRPTQDLRHGRLGIHHFAFLRAWLSGFDLAEAWDRYLSFQGENKDLRHIRAVRVRLWMQVLADAQALNASLPSTQRIDDVLERLQSRQVEAAVVKVPTLDEFCEQLGCDRDFYSEQELKDMLREQYGLEQVLEPEDAAELDPAGGKASPRVRALNTLQTLLAKPVLPGDLLGLWLTAPLTARLAGVGVLRVADLITYMGLHGATWYSKIRGLGTTRAERLQAWLLTNGLMASMVPADDAGEQLSRSGATQACAVVGLDRLVIPEALSGASGGFRPAHPNAYGAGDDLQALRAWLAPYRERARTYEAYHREAERFVLWCILVRQVAVSAITAADCLQYRQFLAHPPAGWVTGVTTARTSPAWRPFRTGALDPASVRHGLNIVRNMYAAWMEEGYVTCNPMATVLRQIKLPAARVNARRGFTREQWRWILTHAPTIATGLRGHRLMVLLQLLEETGLRLSELANSLMTDLEKVYLDLAEFDDALPAPAQTFGWVINVVGKGGKPRPVPISNELVEQLLELHQAVDAASGQPTPHALNPGGDRSLMCALQEPVNARTGAAPAAVFGKAGIYKALKRLFRRLALLAKRQGRADAARLAAASTHWLRHTFARGAVARDVPIGVVQEILGHASERTTSDIYVLQERSRLVLAMSRVRENLCVDIPNGYMIGERNGASNAAPVKTEEM